MLFFFRRVIVVILGLHVFGVYFCFALVEHLVFRVLFAFTVGVFTFGLIICFLALLPFFDPQSFDFNSLPPGDVGLHLRVVLFLEIEAHIDGGTAGHENFNNAPLHMRFHINSFSPIYPSSQ